jgi:hypothetical protein
MVLRSESRAGTPISLIIVHTNEGPHGAGLNPDHTAEDLAAYLDRANAEDDWKSYHLICDDDSTVRYVPDGQAAWSALSANKLSLNICFTGWAAWPRSEWLLHDRMLRRGAVEVAKWAKAYSIPVRKLSPMQVGADWLGICGHLDWTLGKRNGNHTDPGPYFPWDLFINYVLGPQSPSSEDDMPWRLERTPAKLMSKAGDHPDASWSPVEDVITLPEGAIGTATVVGYGGAWIQEAWWGPSGAHIVKPEAPVYAPAFAEQVWKAPAGTRWLTIRYAAPAGGSVGPVTH